MLNGKKIFRIVLIEKLSSLLHSIASSLPLHYTPPHPPSLRIRLKILVDFLPNETEFFFFCCPRHEHKKTLEVNMFMLYWDSTIRW